MTFPEGSVAGAGSVPILVDDLVSSVKRSAVSSREKHMMRSWQYIHGRFYKRFQIIVATMYIFYVILNT
jgi:hypothetical protein